jgi:hypothetical protein
VAGGFQGSLRCESDTNLYGHLSLKEIFVSIHLSIRAEDFEVEYVLKSLKTQFPALQTDEQIFVLERAILWLRAIDKLTIQYDSENLNVVCFGFQDTDLVSLPPAHRPAQSPVSV